MVFPEKHINLEKSYLGLGAKLVPLIPQTGIFLDDLWEKYKENNIKIYHSYTDMVLTLDFLFIIGAIKLEQDGKICLN